MIFESLKKLWLEFLSFFKNDFKKNQSPTFIWFVSEAVKILQAYPKGVSRFILLTELEAKW